MSLDNKVRCVVSLSLKLTETTSKNLHHKWNGFEYKSYYYGIGSYEYSIN